MTHKRPSLLPFVPTTPEYSPDSPAYRPGDPHTPPPSYTFPTRIVYSTPFVNGVATRLQCDEWRVCYNVLGQGPSAIKNVKYRGQIDTRSGLPQGYGKATYPDKTTYHGNWKEGHPHGEGELTDATDNIYEVSHTNGKRHAESRLLQQTSRETILPGSFQSLKEQNKKRRFD